MVRFLTLDSGALVNIADISRISPENKGTRDVYAMKGGFLGNVSYLETSALTDVIIPASGGTRAFVIWNYSDGRPLEADTCCEEHDIIAWRFSDLPEPYPVLIEAPTRSAVVLIRRPDGALVIPGDDTFDNLDAAKRSLLKRWQRAWDEQHRKPSADEGSASDGAEAA